MVATSYFKKKVYAGHRGIDGVSWGVDDISDIWTYFDSAQGKDVTIRSPTYYWDNALRFGRPSDLLKTINIRTRLILEDCNVYFPVIPPTILNDDFLLANTPAEIKNKVITPQTNELSGVEKFPDFAKSGKFQGSNYNGEGILESLVHLDLPELLGDILEGSYARYSTSVLANTQSGQWVPNSYLTMGKFDPIVKLKVRLPNWVVSQTRFFCGLVTADSVLQNDIPYGLNDSVLMMGFRNADSDYKLIRNKGDGTTISPTSTSAQLGHTATTLEFGFQNGGTSVFYRINDGEKVVFNNDIPDPEKWMKLHVNIQNTTAAAKNMDVFYVRFETKR